MDKNGVLTISDWQKGTGDSPYNGFGRMQSVDIFDSPGVLKIGNSVGDASGGITYSGLMVATTKDSYGNTYQLTNDGKLFRNYNTILQSGLGNVYDMVIFKDYLLVRHSTVVSVYGPLAGPAVWYPNWNLSITTGAALQNSYYSKILIDENPDASVGNESIYIANGNTIVKISSFTAGSPPTATQTTGLTLPDGQYAVTMAPLGTNLMIGTQGQTGSWSTAGNLKVANIYPWDKSSSDSFNRPVKLNESGIQAMISDNNKLFIVAGTRGNLYVTDSTNYMKLKRIPWVQSRGFNQSMKVYPNAIAFNNNSNLLIGTSTLADAYNTNTTQQAFHGVYEIDVNSTGRPTVLRYTAGATGQYTGATEALYIGSIFSGSDDSIVFGWQSGSTYGINTTNYVSTTGYVESPLYVVGSRISQKTFQQLEFNLAHPLKVDPVSSSNDGQTISIYYRKTLDDDFTLMGTYTYKNLGGVIGHNTKSLIADVQQVQFKIILTQSASSLSTDNIYLMNVKIW